MIDRRPTPTLALAVALACALSGRAAAEQPDKRYSDRKPAWYDPLGLFVPTPPKPMTDKYGHPLPVGGPVDSPAWKWYGYGGPTPGRNTLAPNGSYPSVPANWHEVAGTTPGAVPVARIGTAVPTPLPEVLPIDPTATVVLPKTVPDKSGPTLGIPPAVEPSRKTAPATIGAVSDVPHARLKMPVPAAEPAPPTAPTQPVSVPVAKPPVGPARTPGAALPNAGSESPDIPVEAAPGIVVPPLTARGSAPERTSLDEFAAVAKRAETRDARILAVDVVGAKAAVVRLTATNVEAARAVRQHFADAPGLHGWRIEFELVTLLNR